MGDGEPSPPTADEAPPAGAPTPRPRPRWLVVGAGTAVLVVVLVLAVHLAGGGMGGHLPGGGR